MTFHAALRHDRIDAQWFIEGPIDGESLRLYVTARPPDGVDLALLLKPFPVEWPQQEATLLKRA